MTSFIGIMGASASVMYHVCSRIMTERLKSHKSLVISRLEARKDDVLHVMRGQRNSHGLNQFFIASRPTETGMAAFPFRRAAKIMHKRRYKCLGVKHCVLVPFSFSGRSLGNSETFEQLLSEQRERRNGSASTQHTAKRVVRTSFLAVQKKSTVRVGIVNTSGLLLYHKELQE